MLARGRAMRPPGIGRYRHAVASRPLARRDFLALAATLAVVSACGNDDSAESATTTVSDGSDETYELIAAFPRSEPYIPTGSVQRLPFLIGIADDAPLDRIDGPVDFQIARDDGTKVGDPISVPARGKGLPRAYLPLEATFAEPGNYLAQVTYGGQQLETVFAVSRPDEVKMPQRGSPLPPFATPTTADARGVAPICTRDPVCPFHDVDLTTALATGGPTVLMISTPLYCQSNICGPVLDVLMDEAGSRSGLSVVHAEVYANPNEVESIIEAAQAPIVAAYGMIFEPCLFVADANGTIVSRLDLIFDQDELSEALDLAS